MGEMCRTVRNDDSNELIPGRIKSMAINVPQIYQCCPPEFADTSAAWFPPRGRVIKYQPHHHGCKGLFHACFSSIDDVIIELMVFLRHRHTCQHH